MASGPSPQQPRKWTLEGETNAQGAAILSLDGPTPATGESVEVWAKKDVLEALRAAPMEFMGEGCDRLGIIRDGEDWADFLESHFGREDGD